MVVYVGEMVGSVIVIVLWWCCDERSYYGGGVMVSIVMMVVVCWCVGRYCDDGCDVLVGSIIVGIRPGRRVK